MWCSAKNGYLGEVRSCLNCWKHRKHCNSLATPLFILIEDFPLAEDGKQCYLSSEMKCWRYSENVGHKFMKLKNIRERNLEVESGTSVSITQRDHLSQSTLRSLDILQLSICLDVAVKIYNFYAMLLPFVQHALIESVQVPPYKIKRKLV